MCTYIYHMHVPTSAGLCPPYNSFVDQGHSQNGVSEVQSAEGKASGCSH